MENIVRFEDYNYLERKKIISRLREAYPILNVKSIGTSCAGREITAIKLGQASEFSLITAAFHGSERITSVIIAARNVRQRSYIRTLRQSRRL